MHSLHINLSTGYGNALVLARPDRREALSDLARKVLVDLDSELFPDLPLGQCIVHLFSTVISRPCFHDFLRGTGKLSIEKSLCLLSLEHQLRVELIGKPYPYTEADWLLLQTEHLLALQNVNYRGWMAGTSIADTSSPLETTTGAQPAEENS